MAQSGHDNLGIVKAYMERIEAGDLEGAYAYAADDAQFRGPDGTVLDKNGLRVLFQQMAPLLPNPLEMQIVGTTVEGRRVAVEATARTTLANGKEYSNIYHFAFEVEDGLIVAAREYCDTSRASAFAG